MDEQQAIREINATMHFQASNRLKSEGLSFHNPELAYLYEMSREELHQWEKLGAIDMAQECRITLDELAGQDEEERAAYDAYWKDHADEAYEAYEAYESYDVYIDEQNMDYHQEAA